MDDEVKMYEMKKFYGKISFHFSFRSINHAIFKADRHRTERKNCTNDARACPQILLHSTGYNVIFLLKAK